ncbi:MAG: 16S rRNA (cytidine(1402)-2'-O)-methyltransferase [Planktomarina sp.]
MNTSDHSPLPSGLYLVATPIGSARDITLRALDILATADVLAAEDTRTARRLMDIHGIALHGRKIWAYHDHSSARDRDRLVAAVASGQSVAYVSEAGTPLIADPGYQLVQSMQADGHMVTSAPGPSAVVNAMVLSGLPTDRFLFAGFLPPSKAARRTAMADLFQVPATVVIYETAKRLPAVLEDLSDTLGPNHQVAMCREMTKKFETVFRASISELQAEITATPPRGEIVLTIAPKVAREAEAQDMDAMLVNALLTQRVKDAADSVAGALGLPRRKVYQRALALIVDKKDG